MAKEGKIIKTSGHTASRHVFLVEDIINFLARVEQVIINETIDKKSFGNLVWGLLVRISSLTDSLRQDGIND